MSSDPLIKHHNTRPCHATWHGMALKGTARPGTARHSTAQPGTARHSPAWHGPARPGPARPGTARHGTARHIVIAAEALDLVEGWSKAPWGRAEPNT